jgi:hypothetical protein
LRSGDDERRDLPGLHLCDQPASAASSPLALVRRGPEVDRLAVGTERLVHGEHEPLDVGIIDPAATTAVPRA